MFKGMNYEKEVLHVDDQFIARSNANTRKQPWVVGLWLGRDSLMNERFIAAADLVHSWTLRICAWISLGFRWQGEFHWCSQ